MTPADTLRIREALLPVAARGRAPVELENVAAYLYEVSDARSGWRVVIFIGRAQRPTFHEAFRSEARRDARLIQLVRRWREHRRRKASERIQAAAFQHDLKADTIMVRSWGYDQTNVDFYKVVRALPKEVLLVKIGARHVSEHSRVVPDPRCTIGDAFRARVRPYGSGTSVLVAFRGDTASVWDGRPQYETAANAGH